MYSIITISDSLVLKYCSRVLVLKTRPQIFCNLYQRLCRFYFTSKMLLQGCIFKFSSCRSANRYPIHSMHYIIYFATHSWSQVISCFKIMHLYPLSLKALLLHSTKTLSEFLSLLQSLSVGTDPAGSVNYLRFLYSGCRNLKKESVMIT